MINEKWTKKDILLYFMVLSVCTKWISVSLANGWENSYLFTSIRKCDKILYIFLSRRSIRIYSMPHHQGLSIFCEALRVALIIIFFWYFMDLLSQIRIIFHHSNRDCKKYFKNCYQYIIRDLKKYLICGQSGTHRPFFCGGSIWEIFLVDNW